MAKVETRHITTHANEVGEQLLAARNELEMSQGELEDRSGIPKARISRYENGKIEPTIGTLVVLARALNTYASSILRKAAL